MKKSKLVFSICVAGRTRAILETAHSLAARVTYQTPSPRTTLSISGQATRAWNCVCELSHLFCASISKICLKVLEKPLTEAIFWAWEHPQIFSTQLMVIVFPLYTTEAYERFHRNAPLSGSGKNLHTMHPWVVMKQYEEMREE